MVQAASLAWSLRSKHGGALSSFVPARSITLALWLSLYRSLSPYLSITYLSLLFPTQGEPGAKVGVQRKYCGLHGASVFGGEGDAGSLSVPPRLAWGWDLTEQRKACQGVACQSGVHWERLPAARPCRAAPPVCPSPAHLLQEAGTTAPVRPGLGLSHLVH